MDIIAEYLPGAAPHANSLCHSQQDGNKRYLMGRMKESKLKLWAESETETIHLLSGEDIHAMLKTCDLKFSCSGVSAWEFITHLRTVTGEPVSWSKKRIRKH